MPKTNPTEKIDTIVSMLTNWQKHDTEHQDRGVYADSFHTYFDSLLERVDWAAVPVSKLRAVVETLVENDDELLEAFVDVAEDNRLLYLQCTHGEDIASVLERCGLGPVEAEQLAHRTIAEALKPAAEVRS